ncbi:TolC family protein [Pseudoxanthomonas beigongshangi]
MFSLSSPRSRRGGGRPPRPLPLLPTLLGCLLLLAVFPAASTPVSLTFPQALRLAEQNAPLLEARQARLEAAREDAGRAAALPDPRLTLGLSNWPINGPDAFDLRADEMTTQEIGLMQEFPARAKRRARQALADAGLEQARAMSLVERNAVRQAAATAWIELWSAQRTRDALIGLREPTDAAVRTARARLAGGSGTTADALAAKSAALLLENRIDAAETAVQAAQAGLSRWLPPQDALPVAQGQAPELTELSPGMADPMAAIERHAALLPWTSQQAVAEAQLETALAGKRPDWSLGVTYGRRDRAPDGMPRSDMLMLEVSVGLPVFTRNRQDRDIAARRAELDAVAAEHEDARRAQQESVRRALASWQGLRRQLLRQRQDVLPLAADRARAALARYAGGGDLQPWLEARRDEIEQHIELARLQGELGRAWAALAHLLPDPENTP